MQIDNIQAKIRPRANWEAIDLGFLMANCWKLNIYKIWFLVTLPIFLLLNLVLHDYMGWVCFIFWLFKPIFDRFILIAVSRRLFGENISIAELIRLSPRLFFRHILKHLTIYRFDPNRAFNLPVWFLENLSGKRRSERARILKITASGSSTLLTFAALHLELFFYVAIIALITSLFPSYMLLGDMFRDSFENIIALYKSNSWYVEFSANIIYYISVTLVEPFYVCAGFALYLNRRTDLESWDIELDFKKMRQRLEEKQNRYKYGNIKTTIMGIIFLGIVSTVCIDSSYADEINSNKTIARVERCEECEEWDKKLSAKPANEPERIIRELLSEDKYKKYTIETKFESKANKDSGKSWWDRFWESLFKNDGERVESSKSDDVSVANIFELILWALGGLSICFLIYQLYKYREYFLSVISPDKDKDEEIPTEIFGLDITPESIPDLLSDEVLKLWENEKFLEALRLLYSGYLSKLVHQFNVDIRISFTENDCLLAAKKVIKQKREVLQIFSQITQFWLEAAYAHRFPTDHELVECCRAWRLQFEVKSLRPDYDQ